MFSRLIFSSIWMVLLVAALAGCNSSTSASSPSGQKPVTLLNVSYDPTREFYQEFNASFAQYWQQQTGQQVTLSGGDQFIPPDAGCPEDIACAVAEGLLFRKRACPPAISPDLSARCPFHPRQSRLLAVVVGTHPDRLAA
jgi:hypothetical protein